MQQGLCLCICASIYRYSSIKCFPFICDYCAFGSRSAITVNSVNKVIQFLVCCCCCSHFNSCLLQMSGLLFANNNTHIKIILRCCLFILLPKLYPPHLYLVLFHQKRISTCFHVPRREQKCLKLLLETSYVRLGEAGGAEAHVSSWKK